MFFKEMVNIFKYFYEDGEYYVGQFFNGLKHGKGTIYYKDGKIKYEGDFLIITNKEKENIYMRWKLLYRRMV